jgi:hypothetical protein
MKTKTSMKVVGGPRSTKSPNFPSPHRNGRKDPSALGAGNPEQPRVDVGGRNTELTSKQSVDEINPPKALAQEGLGEKKESAEKIRSGRDVRKYDSSRT